MKYIDQQADQLHLNLISGAMPRSQVQILCSGELETIYGSVNASIIGASHFFEWKDPHNKTVFSEVFACQKVIVDDVLFYGDVKQADGFKKNIAGVDYFFTAEQKNWDENIISNFKHLGEKATQQQGFALSFQFPQRETETGNNQRKAVTMLSALLNNNQIIVDSLHAYPQEKQLVISQTIINPPGG